MADNALDLSADDLRRLLKKVDRELVRLGQKVTVYVVGGANIALAIDGSRTTTDVDAVVKAGFEHLRRAASAVAATEPGLNSDWINTEFTGGDNPVGGLFWSWFDNRDADRPKIELPGDGLTVELASPEMMLALKTLANRDQDISDIIKLMRLTGVRTREEIGKNLAKFTGPRIFQAQAGDGIYPRIDPQFPHIFDNLPDDLRTSENPSDQSKDRRRKPRCGVVKVMYQDGSVARRTGPCVRRKGHLLPHRFGKES